MCPRLLPQPPPCLIHLTRVGQVGLEEGEVVSGVGVEGSDGEGVSEGLVSAVEGAKVGEVDGRGGGGRGGGRGGRGVGPALVLG